MSKTMLKGKFKVSFSRILLMSFIFAVTATFISGMLRFGLPFGLEYTIEGGTPGNIGGRAVTYILFLAFRAAEVSPINNLVALISVFIANLAFYYCILTSLYMRR